jgi:hypothetical protein
MKEKGYGVVIDQLFFVLIERKKNLQKKIFFAPNLNRQAYE